MHPCHAASGNHKIMATLHLPGLASDSKADMFRLLKLVQLHPTAKQGNQDPSHIILMNTPHTDFYTFRQEGNLSLSEYRAGFKDRVAVLEQVPVGYWICNRLSHPSFSRVTLLTHLSRTTG